MAERLTECIDSHLLDNGEMVKEYSLNSKIELNHFSCMDIPNAVYDKLGELEDILEKYGIESVEELDKKLADSDTWQKACELACKRICYMLDQEMQYHEHEKFNSEEYLKTEIDYFYQQAKNSGEDK